MSRSRNGNNDCVTRTTIIGNYWIREANLCKRTNRALQKLHFQRHPAEYLVWILKSPSAFTVYKSSLPLCPSALDLTSSRLTCCVALHQVSSREWMWGTTTCQHNNFAVPFWSISIAITFFSSWFCCTSSVLRRDGNMLLQKAAPREGRLLGGYRILEQMFEKRTTRQSPVRYSRGKSLSDILRQVIVLGPI